jgi:hypothetical protein
MSKINMELLKKAAYSKTEAEDQEKMERVAACKKKEQEKLDSLIAKYFDAEWEYSINNSLMRVCERSTGDKNSINLYMNFDRKDFVGWNAFVPFKPDDWGQNYNARAPNCIRRFLEYAQLIDMLPGNITFEVWGNFKCTVVFTIMFDGEEDGEEVEVEVEENDTKSTASNAPMKQKIIPKNASMKYQSWADTVSSSGSTAGSSNAHAAH